MSEARVAVLMGGVSSEHDISLSSGRQVLAARPDALPVVLGRDGAWTLGDDAPVSTGAAIDRLRRDVDVVFIALHGPGGEDGVVQGLLDAAGVAYTGSGVLGSALSMDKIRTKLIYESVGLPTPAFEVVDRVGWRAKAAVLDRISDKLGERCVVKRSCEGSSYGIEFPADRAELSDVLDRFLVDESDVLVERVVRGREMTCGVLAIDAEDRVLALPVTEIIPGDQYAYFDLEAKYTPGATQEITPADIPNALTEEIQRLALSAHRWLGCRDFSRTDLFVDAEGKAFLLETNTIPGLTPTSLLPQAAKEAGFEFERLVGVLVDNAARRAGR